MSEPDVLTMLAARAGFYAGEGLNHEEQAFAGELTVEPMVGNRAVLLRYRALGPDGAVYHSEASLVGMREDGVVCMWPVMSELPAILVHAVISTSESPSGRMTVVFRHGDPADEEVFRQELVLDLWPNQDLSYRHAWGLPLGMYKERSSARMKQQKPRKEG